jgi:signal transduction histidine kinase
VLAWAIHWNWRGGLVAGTVVSVVDLSIRAEITQTNYGNVFLLLLGGAVIGYMCQSLQDMASERAVAERRAAVAGERARLARAVHDGVLQVLALVQRKGGTGDAECSHLAGLAGEQEAALRALIHAQDVWTTATVAQAVGRPDDTVERTGHDDLPPRDLAGALEQAVGPTVTVATPGRAVVLPGHVVDALMGAVGACLDNVRLHVGLAAPAWVLVEDHGDRVVVTVRDEGPGIPAGRLDQARAQGRLGVQSSICGRMAEIGGHAEVETGEWGTEWELSVSRDAHA